MVRTILVQATVGGGTVRTVTLKLHALVPQPFDATQVTLVVPIGKEEPDGGLQKKNVPAGDTNGE
jgi:hypothetical protein